jgi:UDP-2,3-diacylglucosamine hydrolase
LFALLHPNIAKGLGLINTRRTRMARGDSDQDYKGDEKERLLVFTKDVLKQKHFDLFVFGHRHYPLDMKIAENSRYINLGDWIYNFTYGVLDGKQFELKKFE